LEGEVAGNFICDPGSNFPDWPSRSEGSLRFGLGASWKKTLGDLSLGPVKLPKAEVVGRPIGSINGKFGGGKGLRFGNPWGSIAVLFRAKWTWFGGRAGFAEYTFTWPSVDVGPIGSSDDPLFAMAEYDQHAVFRIVADANTGTWNQYTAPAEQMLTHNLYDDGPPVIAEDLSGNLFAAWTNEDGIVVSPYNAAADQWDAPVLIPASGGYADQGLAMAFDGLGDAIAVWSRRDVSWLTPDSTSDQIRAVLESPGELTYARWDHVSGTWSTPMSLGALAVFGDDAQIQRIGNGQIVAAWLAPSSGNSGRVLRAAFWDPNSGTWSTPIDVAAEYIVDAPSIGEVNGTPILVWAATVGADAGSATTLRFATWNGTIWSAADNASITLSESLVASLISAADIEHSNQAAMVPNWIPLSPVPEKCCKCQKWDTQYQGTDQGCGFSTEIGPENCKKVIKYKPCVPPPVDPNDSVGPVGYGDERWIAADRQLYYMIRFENDPLFAQAPAQKVVITQQLDADLEWRSLRLGDFGFGGLVFTVPANQAYYSTLIDLTAERGYFVDVTAGIDVRTGQTFWTLVTIDPATGEQPLDPQVGFLAINDDQGAGQGWVSYSVRPKRTAATGDVIDAQARIVFDTEAPIDTPPIFNTLDAGKPQSAVATLPTMVDDASFTVSWTDGDDQGGSGLGAFHVFVSENDGPFRPWLLNTQLTSAQFLGVQGRRYAFYSVPVDRAGNVENEPPTPDAVTVTPGATATIGDWVWVDANANGIQDEGEVGRPGVTVRLYLADRSDPLAETVTDADGRYTFAGLDISQSYFLEFVAPAGYGFSLPDAGADDTLDSDPAIATGRTSVFILIAGLNTQWDAGRLPLGSIGGVVWLDDNGNGQRESNEVLLPGQVVYLDLDQDGQKGAEEPQAVTDECGRYLFRDLRPGQYVVRLVVPSDWEQTHPRAGGAYTFAYTGSDAALFAPAWTYISGVATAQVANPTHQLIGLDVLRNDPRFANLDGRGLAVVVIDTGLCLDHPFFGPDADGDGVADRIVFQYDFADRDARAADVSGHGSHVTSIIASEDEAYPGVAPAVNIVHLKVFSDNVRGNFGYLEQALQWVIRNVDVYRIAAVNLSLGDGQNWAQPVGLYGVADQLAALDALGVITVAAAGNSYAIFDGREGLAYPAADPHSLSMGAVWDSNRGPQSFGSYGTDYTTAADRLASFSQRHRDDLDALAPGALITAASATGGIATMRGTSMAAPFVTGAAVLAQQLALQQHGQRLSTAQFRELLRSSGVAVVDGNDEDDNVPNTGSTFFRLYLRALAEAVCHFNASSGSGGSGGSPGNGGGALDLLNGSFAYTIQLGPGQQRDDVDFGIRPRDLIPPEVVDVVDVTPNPRRTPVAAVAVQMSEEIDLTTFDFADITLTRNGN